MQLLLRRPLALLSLLLLLLQRLLLLLLLRLLLLLLLRLLLLLLSRLLSLSLLAAATVCCSPLAPRVAQRVFTAVRGSHPPSPGRRQCC